MPQDPLSRDAAPDITTADRHFVAREWAEALRHYEAVGAAEPALADSFSLPLLIGHCRIELADGALPNLPEAVATGSPREQLSIKFARARALEMCRAGDRVRASQLLRFLAGYDPTMADTYRDMLAPGRSPASLAPTVERDPPFIQALGIADVPIDALKQAHHGKRLLLVYRRFFPAGGVRQSEVIECLASSATRFGLVVRAFEFDGSDSTGLASALLQEILAFRPDLIVYDHEYPVSMSGEPAAIREQIETVFAMARQQLDVRIVLSYMDAWQAMPSGPSTLFQGLGQAYDLVQHGHPAARGVGTPAQNARAFCYMLPSWAAKSSVAPGTVSRACFVGGISWFNVSRLAWWAETGRRGLPIDFFETLHLEGEPRSDRAYVDLLVRHQLALNFTRRAGGPKIMTARSLEIPLAGGLLLEENSSNTAFFLQPGEHYVPFESLDDLAALIPELLVDGERRARIRAAGQRWVQTYFTGDYFWAGLLRQLFG